MILRRASDAHVVPLPPQAWTVVKRAMALAGDSERLFPAMRRRHKGSELKSMASASLTHLFQDVTGNDCHPHSMRLVPSRRWLELGWRSLRVAQPQ